MNITNQELAHLRDALLTCLSEIQEIEEEMDWAIFESPDMIASSLEILRTIQYRRETESEV